MRNNYGKCSHARDRGPEHKIAETQKMRACSHFLSLKHASLGSSSMPVTLVSAVGSDAKCLDQVMHHLCCLKIQEGVLEFVQQELPLSEKQLEQERGMLAGRRQPTHRSEGKLPDFTRQWCARAALGTQDQEPASLCPCHGCWLKTLGFS